MLCLRAAVLLLLPCQPRTGLMVPGARPSTAIAGDRTQGRCSEARNTQPGAHLAVVGRAFALGSPAQCPDGDGQGSYTCGSQSQRRRGHSRSRAQGPEPRGEVGPQQGQRASMPRLGAAWREQLGAKRSPPSA